uniref:CSON007008 protein n=1 Tax=Culicoides sonorensis TaxID=179676 RepID=A0A336MZJ5_CULSO
MLKLSEKHLDFTEQDIIDEACTLMLAGQDSTGSAIAFTLYYLATHPEYQEKCYQEINQLYKDKTEDDPLTLKEVKELRFLEMCIKETLRLQPSIIIFGRKLSEDTKIRGMKVLISLILRKFKIVAVPGVTKSNPVFRITVRAAGGIWLKFEQRK